MLPKVKFVMAGHLGWGTYRSRIEQATKTYEGANVVVEHFTPPDWVRKIGRVPRYEEHLPKTLSLCSEYEAYRLSGKFFQPPLGDCDVVIGVESHVAAALLPRTKGRIPTVQILDATLSNMRDDFGILGISNRDIAVETKIFHEHAHTITMSNWAAETLRKKYGIEPDKITVVPPPSY